MTDIRIERAADPAKCPICGADYKEVIPELVRCPSCGFQEASLFGVVKEYIDKNGISTVSEVSKSLGIPVRKINNYLRSGQLEIPEGSAVFIHCKQCGTEIRFGKYCKECANILRNDLTKSIEIKESEIGEVPKKMEGKMHFINKEKR